MFFDELTENEILEVEAIGVLSYFDIDDSILVEGQKGTSLCLLKSGRAHIRKKLEGERSLVLLELEPGDMFGEMSFLALDMLFAGVVAIEPCTVMTIERDDFIQLTSRFPAIGVKVYRSMAQELARRLSANSEELRRAILWALEEMNGLDCNIRP